ncbi:MAG: hypothetical protein V4672_09995 [Verrucomicrobiota bacterium]
MRDTNENFEEGLLLPRSRNGKARFVCVPLEWIRRAASAPAQSAVQVALLVWYRKSVTGEAHFAVSNIVASYFGLDRKQKAAGLKALAGIGMIALQPRPGRSPLVTVLG